MNRRKNTILFAIGALITALVVYVTVRLWASEAVFSVVPGWHTIIYPPEITWAMLTVIILVTSLLVYFVFRGTIKVLTVLWTKIMNH